MTPQQMRAAESLVLVGEELSLLSPRMQARVHLAAEKIRAAMLDVGKDGYLALELVVAEQKQ